MTQTLYVVATPIGNLADISQRALDTLTKVDIIAAEDTRHSKKLLNHYGIQKPMLSLHAHNESERAQSLIAKLTENKSIALISDAGTPAISDPGQRCVEAVKAAGFDVVPIPGACALVAALSASGLPSSSFLFKGFLSSKTSSRRSDLEALVNSTHTLLFYEAPHRIIEFCEDIVEIFGAKRRVSLAKELTKTYEAICTDTAANVLDWLKSESKRCQGEFVVMIAPGEEQSTETLEIQRVLAILLDELPTKQAASLAAKITGSKRNEVYKMALALK